MFSGMTSGGGQNSGGCEFSRAPGCALLHGARVESVSRVSPCPCLLILHSQVEREVSPLCSSTALFWGRLDLGVLGTGQQDSDLGPSEQDLPTSSTSWKRPKPEEGKEIGMGVRGLGWDQQLS